MHGFKRAFDERLADGDLDGAEEAWLEALDADAPPRAELLAAAEALIAAGEEERAAVLLELASGVFEEAPPEECLRHLRVSIRSDPGRKDLRRAYVERFRAMHPGARALDLFLRLADVPGAEDPAAAMERLDALMRYGVGAYVEHPGGWGVGRVVDVLPDTAQLVVDLERRRGHRIAVDAVPNVLRPLDAQHFSALRFDRIDALRARAREDPVGLVRLVLASFGPSMALKAVKGRLVPDVVPADEWTSFWSRARSRAKRDPYLRISPAHPVRIEILETPVRYEEEALERLERGDGRRRAALLRALARDGRLEGPFREAVLARLDPGTGSPGERLERLFLRREIGVGDREVVAAFLGACEDPLGAIAALPQPEYRREALGIAVPRLDPASRRRAFLEGTDEQRDAVALEERAAPDGVGLLAELVREIEGKPRRHAAAFLWLARALEAGTLGDLGARLSRRVVFGKLLALLSALTDARRREGARDLVAGIRSFIASSGYASFRRIVESLDETGARDLRSEIHLNRGLSPAMRTSLEDILLSRFPGAAREPRTATSVLEDRAIWTTDRGLARRREEYRELVERKLPRVFEEIGRAAAFGDISDNAEYTAALEERDRLSRRAGELKAELERVRRIEPALLEPGVVTLGAFVRAREEPGGAEIRFRLLGPWDGGPEEGVVSYLAPVGRALLGARVGDRVEVELPSGRRTYEVLEVGDGLAEPEGS